ncbi:glutaredoxin family protein [Candidatus Woesearchaeota archaeon]|jgi:glutaredoxin 3|nr:glutaredoxin family protein [Candidatus Woesearchaeota archaeon]
MVDVIVYTAPGCSACSLLKNFLKENKVEFKEVNLMADRKKAQEIVARSGAMSVPQVELDGEIIVGFNKEALKAKLGL